jgi:hypothetical protein
MTPSERLRGNHNNLKHGMRAKRPIIRELLTDDEKTVWDETPVPPEASDVLADMFRRVGVILYRFDKWYSSGKGRLSAKTKPQTARYYQEIMLAPLAHARELYNSHLRAVEAESGNVSSEQLQAYLAGLTAAELAAIQQGEMPRLNPSSGEIMDAEVVDDDGQDPVS